MTSNTTRKQVKMERSNNKTTDPWQALYKTAAVLAMLIVLAGLIDTITSMLGGEVRQNSAIGIVEWFSLFQNRPFSAFSYLGLINMVTLSLSAPIFLALCRAHWKTQPAFAALATVFFFMGVAIYISTNTVFSLFALSRQYAAAAEAQKPFLEASGRALLALGADLTPGTFKGFFFTQMAGLLMTGVMLRGRVFGKWTGWFGLAGYILMSIFFVLAAFVPESFNLAVAVSMPGGLLLLAYHILLAKGFFQLSRQSKEQTR